MGPRPGHLPAQRLANGTVRASGHNVGVFLLGVIFLFAAPWVMRGFVTVDKLLIRTLLGPDPVAARVRSLEQARTHDGRRLGRHPAAHRAGPARRHAGPAGRPGHAARHGEGEARRPRRTSTSNASASSSTRRTAAPRRPSPSCATSPAASTRPRSTSGSRARWPRSPPAAPSPPSCNFDVHARPTPAIEAIAYYCVAELLANVAQHAQASRATVSCAQQGTWLRLVVRDDGRGGARLSTVGSTSSGLAGLTDRVRTVDGRLDLVSPAGGPTVVTVDLPLSVVMAGRVAGRHRRGLGHPARRAGPAPRRPRLRHHRRGGRAVARSAAPSRRTRPTSP